MSIVLSSVSALSVAVERAKTVDLSAYTMRDGRMRAALVAAAGGGATVRVRLERDPLDDAAGTLHAANADSVALLRAAGADASLTSAGEPVLHMKAAVVDGVAWLDDRNWAANDHETVLRDSDPDDVAAVADALRSGPGADGHLRSIKRDAQYLELDVIRAAGTAPLALESESFGGGAIYNALLARARSGAPTRLLVAGREALQAGPSGDVERRRLAHLATLGVAVRTGDPAAGDLDEKLAVAGHAAWAGSANATYARGPAGDQRDWGLATRVPALVDALRAQFESNWQDAVALPGGTLTDASCVKPSATFSATRPLDRSCARQSTSGATSH